MSGSVHAENRPSESATFSPTSEPALVVDAKDHVSATADSNQDGHISAPSVMNRTASTAPTVEEAENAVQDSEKSRLGFVPLTPPEEAIEFFSAGRKSVDYFRQRETSRPRNLTIQVDHDIPMTDGTTLNRRPKSSRALSTPVSIRALPHDIRKQRLSFRNEKARQDPILHSPTSPPPASAPLPSLSLSSYLHYELSSHGVSPLIIQKAAESEFPYESSRVKIERLVNFLFLPLHLEGCLWFGVLACLDCWLYIFTILPLRMLKSIFMLVKTWTTNVYREVSYVVEFVFTGLGRIWSRKRAASTTASPQMSRASSEVHVPQQPQQTSGRRRHHRRTKSRPSNLLPNDKADLLKGLLIICTCLILLRLDASKMYHWVRGQAAIKLYVIYNLLEVCDRLLSAIGQDVLECLFSRETLERKSNGRSKILRPFWLFAVALVYSVIHATALFYQVVTLNVAVNSYSNALITLLLSNQFVEIKGTVFKKFEKESLFQITCSDIVERFQLWHMLMIIASRNIVETGGLSLGLPNLLGNPATATATTIMTNTTFAAPPRMASSILPSSFMIVPSMLKTMSTYVPQVSHVLGPFVIVLGSEMFIDWLKHAYIGKFNNTRPIIYSRFLDVLAKDYYINAFGEQNLMKRLGLPIIPLSCLMIRAGFQTYQMFVASWVPGPSSTRPTATVDEIYQQYSATRPIPSTVVGLIVRKMDDLVNQLPAVVSDPAFTTRLTALLVLVLMFLVLLLTKLILGMTLLLFSRARYKSMQEHVGNKTWQVDGGRRLGGWGVVEVDEAKRRIIYEDDPAGYQAARNRESKDKLKRDQEERATGFGIDGLEKVIRYDMVAKRIW